MPRRTRAASCHASRELSPSNVLARAITWPLCGRQPLARPCGAACKRGTTHAWRSAARSPARRRDGARRSGATLACRRQRPSSPARSARRSPPAPTRLHCLVGSRPHTANVAATPPPVRHLAEACLPRAGRVQWRGRAATVARSRNAARDCEAGRELPPLRPQPQIAK